jgi:hypothetical protein
MMAHFGMGAAVGDVVLHPVSVVIYIYAKQEGEEV